MSARRIGVGRLSVYIEPRDLWVGAYVAEHAVYVCPLPLIVFRWTRGKPFAADAEGDIERQVRAEAAAELLAEATNLAEVGWTEMADHFALAVDVVLGLPLRTTRVAVEDGTHEPTPPARET